jgi:hypothetical protein
LRAIGEHPPLAVGRAGKVNREHVEIRVRRNAHTYHWPQECGIGVEKFGWEMAALQQRLRSVKILENQTQQSRALDYSLLNIPPLVGRKQERDDINFPRAVCT